MKKSLITPRTAHYHLQEGKSARTVLYVIHGYGQLAGEFLSEFEYLKTAEALVVAPEALSRFYNKRQEAVANWMTSHEREDEIKDYLEYLNLLHKEIKAEYQPDQFMLLGFSQGVSTAMRWLASLDDQFSAALFCGGSIPPELKAEDLKSQAKCHFYYAYGNADKLLSEKKANEYLQALKDLIGEVQAIPFEGGHEVGDRTKELISRLV